MKKRVLSVLMAVTKKLSWKLPHLCVQRKAPPTPTLLFISIHSFLKYL